VARTVQGVVVTLAGVAGVLVLLAALAPLAGLQLVRLATGSMSPGYPAGSVLLVQDVAAGEVVPGDVVTVMRADGSPVTHRVVEVEPVRGGARLVLRGDANEQVDPAPYLATRVGRVIGGIPVGGGVFDLARSPFAVPLLGAAASLIVLWAWWPARRVPAHRMRAAARLAESRGGVR
jgi:signal peptidase